MLLALSHLLDKKTRLRKPHVTTRKGWKPAPVKRYSGRRYGGWAEGQCP